MQTAITPAAATDATFVASDACPVDWPALRARSPGDTFDGNVSVLVGGNLSVRGSAAGAEGVVVARGDATFARETPGPYEVGVTGLGSQVPPYADSDMLVVGGNLTGDPGTHVDVGQGLGGDVAVGGAVTDGTDAALHGGQLDAGVTDATAPYDGLLAGLAAKSAGYAARPTTGTAVASETALTLTGDGVSDPQVFTVDGATLGAINGVGRSLQVLGVPKGAGVVINLTGPAVDLDIDSLLSAEGTVVDPLLDPAFGDLATHLLWNAATATAVDIGGLAQLPGTLLVPTSPSTTTLAGAGTNGRVLVAGDLVHTGAGQLHAYPFLPDADLEGAPEVAHLGTVTLDVRLSDPGKVVDPDRFFQGQFRCELDGKDVTPNDNTWQVRAGADPRVLSDKVPVGAVCTVTERLEEPPAEGWTWAEPQFKPEQVKAAKRDPRGITVSNRALAPPPPPPPAPTDDPTPSFTSTPDVQESEVPQPEATPTSTPTSQPEPTERPDPSEPSTLPTAEPSEQTTPTADAAAEPKADAPNGGQAGALTTTAPFTLRGSFVWGPLLMLSLLTMVIRIRRRPKPQRLH